MIEFVFFADRLAALVLEHALQLLPFKDQDIRTRTGVPYVGKVLDAQVRPTPWCLTAARSRSYKFASFASLCAASRFFGRVDA